MNNIAPMNTIHNDRTYKAVELVRRLGLESRIKRIICTITYREEYTRYDYIYRCWFYDGTRSKAIRSKKECKRYLKVI